MGSYMVKRDSSSIKTLLRYSSVEKALTNKGFRRSSIASIFSIVDNCQVKNRKRPRRSKAQAHHTSCCSNNQGQEWNFSLDNCALKDLGVRFY
ncbi:hypothetical protein SLEP1_g60052 [Rubroshorea leprosula]|uniref:Uncharacterized protein n=1 Tax=Rubroshorea leprosula TaxID=152421 RepID=A0AAV5MY98_9ROSI|nr:hypothetical protein SLEP1_g60052 [Rubroshorea leprosula]